MALTFELAKIFEMEEDGTLGDQQVEQAMLSAIAHWKKPSTPPPLSGTEDALLSSNQELKITDTKHKVKVKVKRDKGPKKVQSGGDAILANCYSDLIPCDNPQPLEAGVVGFRSRCRVDIPHQSVWMAEEIISVLDINKLIEAATSVGHSVHVNLGCEAVEAVCPAGSAFPHRRCTSQHLDVDVAATHYIFEGTKAQLVVRKNVTVASVDGTTCFPVYPGNANHVINAWHYSELTAFSENLHSCDLTENEDESVQWSKLELLRDLSVEAAQDVWKAVKWMKVVSLLLLPVERKGQQEVENHSLNTAQLAREVLDASAIGEQLVQIGEMLVAKDDDVMMEQWLQLVMVVAGSGGRFVFANRSMREVMINIAKVDRFKMFTNSALISQWCKVAVWLSLDCSNGSLFGASVLIHLTSSEGHLGLMLEHLKNSATSIQTVEEAANWCETVGILALNATARIAFGCTKMHDAVVVVGNKCESLGSLRMWCAFMSLLCRRARVRRVFSTLEMHDVLLKMTFSPHLPGILHKWCFIVLSFTIGSTKPELFGTALLFQSCAPLHQCVEIMGGSSDDGMKMVVWCQLVEELANKNGNEWVAKCTKLSSVLVTLTKYCWLAEPASKWCSVLLAAVKSGKEASAHLATPEINKALCSFAVAPYFSSVAAKWLRIVLCLAQNNPQFGVPQVVIAMESHSMLIVNTLSVVGNEITATESAIVWCTIVADLAANRTFQSCLSTTKMRDSLVKVASAVQKRNAQLVEAWGRVLVNLVVGDSGAQQQFSTPSTRTAMFQLARAVEDSPRAAEVLCRAAIELSADVETERNFAVSDLPGRFFLPLAGPAQLSVEATTNWCWAVANVSYLANVAELLAEPGVVAALVDMSEIAATSPLAARHWCAAVANVGYGANGSDIFFSQNLHRAVLRMEGQAKQTKLGEEAWKAALRFTSNTPSKSDVLV